MIISFFMDLSPRLLRLSGALRCLAILDSEAVSVAPQPLGKGPHRLCQRHDPSTNDRPGPANDMKFYRTMTADKNRKELFGAASQAVGVRVKHLKWP